MFSFSPNAWWIHATLRKLLFNGICQDLYFNSSCFIIIIIRNLPCRILNGIWFSVTSWYLIFSNNLNVILFGSQSLNIFFWINLKIFPRILKFSIKKIYRISIIHVSFRQKCKLNLKTKSNWMRKKKKRKKKSLNVKSIHDDDSVERGEKFFTTNTTLDLES